MTEEYFCCNNSLLFFMLTDTKFIGDNLHFLSSILLCWVSLRLCSSSFSWQCSWWLIYTLSVEFFFFLRMNNDNFKNYSRWDKQTLLHDVSISPSKMDKSPLMSFKVFFVFFFFFATILWLAYTQNILKVKFHAVLL